MAATRNVVRYGLEMRAQFDFSKYRLDSWFPRHMRTALLQVMGKLHSIDGVIEVHDARVPFTGRNLKLADIGILKPSVLVMNKVDLIDPCYQEYIASHFADIGQQVIFTNSKDPSGESIKNLIPKFLDRLTDGKHNTNRSDKSEINLMILGIPNVGKSSLINALRSINVHRKKAAAVAPRPGVTRSVMERIKVYWRPAVYIRDTPGVLSPSLPSVEAGLKLALSSIVSEHLVGADIMADYLLFRLNKAGRREYVDLLKMSGPTDNYLKLLATIAERRGMIRHETSHVGVRKIPELRQAAEFFIRLWRNGELGCQMLDDSY